MPTTESFGNEQSQQGAIIQSLGRVAQLGEHLLCKQGVGGSNPPTSTTFPLEMTVFETDCAGERT